MDITTVPLDVKTRKRLALMKIRGGFRNYDELLSYLIKKKEEAIPL